MSLSSNLSYNIQIDSEYRDISKYPTFTDFGIKFKNQNTGTSLNGYPYSNTGGYNLQTQIDPDFISSDFQVINGSLQHIQRDSDGNVYLSGTIDILTSGQQFEINKNNYRILTLTTNTIPNVFVGKFTALNSDEFYLSWICYLTPDVATTYRLSPTRSTMDIDENLNIYWTFDCSFNKVNVFSSLYGILYTIEPENYVRQRQYEVIASFTNLGNQYAVNGVPWGFHLISSNNDLTATLENGRNYIKTNTALDIFSTLNTNPYDPYTYERTGIANNVSGTIQNSHLFMLNTGSPYYDENPRYLYWRKISSSSIGFEYYKIVDNEYEYISTFDNTTVSPWVPTTSSWWNLSFVNDGNYIYIIAPQTEMWLMRFNLITQSMDLKYHQNLGINPGTGIPPYIGTNSTMIGTLDSTSTNIYIALSNVLSIGGTYGSLLYSLDKSNPTGSGGAQLIYWDNTNNPANYGRTIDVISYNQYIIEGHQANSTGGTIFKLYSYNTSSGTYISSSITEINNYKINILDLASPTFFIDLNNNLCCCLTTIDRSIIFKINPADLSITYLSQVNNLTGNEVSVYGGKKVVTLKDNTKLYLIGTTNGSISDFSSISYPYQITSTYPEIDDGLNMFIYNAVNTPNGNFLGGLFFPLTSAGISTLFTAEFIDTPNTISSEHYTKPVIQYYPDLSPDTGRYETYKDIFSIEGYESNVSTNFSPSQFIGNGLIAWYNCRQQNNLITSSGTVTGILDFSGNGLNLYSESGSNFCPTFNLGGVVWDCSSNQITTFSTSGAFTGNSIKFIIASYTSPTTYSYIVQGYSGSNVNAELSPTGVAMRYNNGLEYTYYDSSVFDTIISTEFNPVYFGYNTPESLQPYLAYQNSSITFSDRGLSPLETSTNKISVMKNLTVSSGQPVLYELILLDFIPTQYQLSLFQSYFNSTVYTYPQVIPKLSGVFTLYTSTIGGPTDLYIKSIDGSSIPYNDLYPIQEPYNNFTNYVQVKYIRKQGSSKPNYICTICDDEYVRIYRLDDYFNRSYSYSQYDLSYIGWPLYSIEPYIDSSGNVKIVVSTYDTNTTAGAGSPTLIHLSITEGVGLSDTITLLSSYTYPILGGYYPNINTLKPYTYDNGNTYLFVITSLNLRDGGSGRIVYPVFYVYNITSGSFTQIYSFPSPPEYLPNENLIDSAASKRSSSIIKYPNNNIYFVYKVYNGGNNKIYNITDPNNIVIIGMVKSGLTQGAGGYPSPADRTLPQFTSPIDMYVNPLTNNVYLMDSFYLLNGSGTGSISFYNYTDTKSISSEYFIPQIFYNPINDTTYDVSSYFITNIKTTVWNQKVWSMITFSDSSFNNIGSVFIDISNIEFVSQSYIDNKKSTLVYSNTYENIKGIGAGIIHKISNNGIPGWIATIGGDGSSGNNKWASNINISNIDIDNTLTYAYIVGSWKHKIQTFVNSDENGNIISPYKMNSITSTPIDNNVNSFMCKININNGNFVWLIPTFGTNDDYNQRVMFNRSNSTISVVSYFSSPVMLVYQPQQSSTTTWTNPINTVLNISNISSITSALFTFNTNGSFIWSSKLYSQEQSSKTRLYDLYIENGQITSIGITNANTLNCIDSTSKNVQNTYTSINPINQQAIILYTFDNNGVYQQSQKNELPPGMNSSVFDVNSYSSLNRIVYFINNSINANNGNLTFYNKDGTLASTLSTYPINKNFSQIVQYKYDSSFTDTNGKKYSQLKLASSITGTLNNYKVFIQGGTEDVSIFESTNQTILNSDSILNSNFSIRSNTENIITLNSLISTNKIERYSSISQWNSLISQTSLYGMVSISTGNNLYRISQLFSSPPSIVSTTGTYYVIYPNSSNNLISIEVTSVSEYRGLYTFTTLSPITDNINNPYVYFTTINKNANYTLQFYPGSLNKDVYFNISLTSLTIPNRPVKSYDFSGVRYLNDFPYIYLVIVNTDDNDIIDPNIFNNFYSNNIDRSNTAIFTLSSNTLSGGTNFSVLNTSYTPKIKFSPGFYNIRVRLYDPDGNIIIYDNTPTISSDSVFTGGTVPDKLMRLILAFTLRSTT